MQYIFSFVLPIISYFLQIYPRIYNKYFGVDVWTLLIEIDLIKKNMHRIPLGKINKGFILDGYFDYPPLFLILLSFLPKKFLLRNQGFISPISDALLNVCIFYLTYNLTHNIGMALVAQLVYTFIPVAALENSALLPRSLGYSLFMLSFYFLLVFTSSVNHQIWALVVSVVFAALTLLSHKFATQSFLFVSVFFTLFERNPYYLGVFLLAVVLAIIFSKGYYLRVLKSHLLIIYFWTKNRKNRFAHQIYGNISMKKNPDMMGIIYTLLKRLAPVTLLSANPWVLSVVFYLFFQPADFPVIISKMAVWIIFFYLFGILVLMIPQLTPIGEGYRYMEMTTLPSAILTSYMLFYMVNSIYGIYSLGLFLLILLVNFSVVLFVQKKAIISDSNRSLTDNMSNAFDFINTLPNTPRIMCVPQQITTMTIYSTTADVLVNFDVPGLFISADFYPILKKSVMEIARKYNIDYLLLRESFVKTEDLKLQKPKILFQSGDIVLIDLRRNA